MKKRRITLMLLILILCFSFPTSVRADVIADPELSLADIGFPFLTIALIIIAAALVKILIQIIIKRGRRK